MNRAAMSGHFAIIKWLHMHRREGCSSAAIDNAAGIGRLDIIQWLDAHYASGCTSRAMSGAAFNGHLDVILFLESKGMAHCTPDVAAKAVYIGHLEILQWLFQTHRESIDEPRVYRIAKNYDLYCLDWLISVGVNFATMYVIKCTAIAHVFVGTNRLTAMPTVTNHHPQHGSEQVVRRSVSPFVA
jgi:hypothetical protein